MTATPTDIDHVLEAAARRLAPTLNRIADRTVTLKPARTYPVPNECLSCRRPGTLSLIILGPKGSDPAAIARIVLCKTHRAYLTDALAGDQPEPLQIEGRDILALDPTTITPGAKQ